MNERTIPHIINTSGFRFIKAIMISNCYLHLRIRYYQQQLTERCFSIEYIDKIDKYLSITSDILFGINELC